MYRKSSIVHSPMPNSKKERFINWVRHNYDKISFIVSAVCSFFASIIENRVYDALIKESKESAVLSIFIKFVLLFFCVMFIVLLCYLSVIIKKRLNEYSDYSKFISEAYYETRKLSLSCQAQFQEICNGNSPSNARVIEWLKVCMQSTITSCYNFFCKSFDTGNALIDDIKFEVTFMTRSYIDKKITIPFSYNKEQRTPTSMLLRAVGNVNIYDETVTSEIYQEYEQNRKATFRLISDTTDPKGNNGGEYHFLYSDQENRIKSSIVAPIVSHHSELLGTIVVHCDQVGFFKEVDRAFWSSIMDAFASEMGKYILMMNYFREGENVY